MDATNGVLSVGEWRKSQGAGELVTLPSGRVVRRKRVHLLDLAAQGEIPDGLAGLAAELVSAGKQEIKPAEMRRYAGVINLVCKAALVDPPMGDAATETQIAPNEMDMLDRLAIFNDSHLGLRGLRKFRPQQKKPVEAAQPGAGIRDAAGGDSGDNG